MALPSAQADYAAFEEKFGNVKSVHFVPNYIEPMNIPQCALVEMVQKRICLMIARKCLVEQYSANG
ncbi:hypothetical protein CFP56_008149 [Quercus suber]|uniref:Uncharacterized protein n=1 Tax=Quercus suber TaxID=58331 RepID=A0AAW0L3H1_QUESU